MSTPVSVAGASNGTARLRPEEHGTIRGLLENRLRSERNCICQRPPIFGAGILSVLSTAVPLKQAPSLTPVLNSTAHDATRRLRAGSVLPDEVHLLQLPHGRVFKRFVRAVCSARSAARSPNSRVCSRENRIADVPEAVVDTVYFGGGTPSLLEPARLAQIIDAIRASFPSQFEEVTLEADPETISPEKAVAWRDAGFNRISMGVQSFDDARIARRGTDAPPRRCFQRHENSSRRRIRAISASI